MAQSLKLVTKFSNDLLYSFKVGSVDIVAHTLYVRDSAGLLVQADASSVGPFFLPITAEKAGMSVSAVLIGAGTVILLGSGAISKGAKLTNAAAGKVAAAGAGDEIVGTAWDAAGDGELLSVVTQATVGGIYPSVLAAANGETVEEAWYSEEMTLATDAAATTSAADLIPANSLILGTVIRVTQAINNRTAFIVGTAGDDNGLVVTGTTLTLNSTAVGTGALIGTFNAAAAKVVITGSGGSQNTTGKVRVSVLVRKLTAPTS